MLWQTCAAMTEPDGELTRLRVQVDAINQQLVAVLHQRAALCRRIAAWKRSHGVAAADPVREAAMLTELTNVVPPDGFAAEALASVLRTVFAASRALVASIAPPTP
jgi:chorismate mutase